MHINLAVSYLPQKFFVNAPKKRLRNKRFLPKKV